MKRLVFASLTLLLLLASAGARAERLRDLVEVSGARENQILGYGIVTGLAGTGDDPQAPFAGQTVLALLRRLGVQLDPRQMQLRNVAAVVVTATIPPFAKSGTKIDVTVASVGNARSIGGGMLVQTLLKGPDGHTYAVAQGNLVVGGFDARGSSGSSVRAGNPSAGRIPEGAILEREVQSAVVVNQTIRLSLRMPGFSQAARIAEAINKRFAGAASAVDSGAVSVRVPAGFEGKSVELVATIEELEVTPVHRARVVINERTGTIVAGGDVRLSPVAIVHGGITIVVKEQPKVSQPTAPFGTGTTQVVPGTEVHAKENQGPVAYVPAAPTLADVAAALGSLALNPRELTSVLQALRAAGALEAEVVVQ